MKKRTKKIGFFDSGLGGLNILSYVIDQMPEYDYVYLGDTARVPYGNRSAETVYKFSLQALDFLFDKDCDLVVLACNTASCEALRRIQQEFLPQKHPDKKVLGVIIPACEAIVECESKKVGLIATRGTVNSGAFEREIKNLNLNVELRSVACPLFVPVIEAGEEENSQLLEILFKTYLMGLKQAEIDTLILACTHYGIIESQISSFFEYKVKIINEGPIVAKKLEEYLQRHPEIEIKLSKNADLNVYTTDMPIGFQNLAQKFFGRDFKAQTVNIDK